MKSFLISLRAWVVLSLLTGALYPLFVTGLGQLIFPFQAGGSLIVEDGKPTGSRLLAQAWGTGWFLARPSAVNYDSMSSGASNLSATSATLHKVQAEREAAWIARVGAQTSIPEEMLAASGGGFDPDISLESAQAQAEAVLRERDLEPTLKADLLILISENAYAAGLFGEGRLLVNVQELNRALGADARFAFAGQDQSEKGK